MPFGAFIPSTAGNAGSDWINGDPTKLIRILLHGLSGPITVSGQSFGGPDAIPMPAFGLSDGQIADVLTYVRGNFGNKAKPVSPDEVKAVRSTHANRETPWTAAELAP